MRTSYRLLAEKEPCSYLPDQQSRMEYEFVLELTADEYAERMVSGWRRFGHTLLRPRCLTCTACQSLRVDVSRFRPDRSQRRTRKANEARVTLDIGEPRVSAGRLELYNRFHSFRARTRGWADRVESESDFVGAFVINPFPTEEWRYGLDGKLVGLGYVDALSVGLSAIYFVHDPAHLDHELGTWNLLRLIDEARSRGLPHVYLGYWVAGCQSLAYKANFGPHEILEADGCWRPVEG